MKFSEVLRSFHKTAEGWSASVPADWMIGRTTFGGLQAALAVKAMREVLPDRSVPLRTLQCTFLAPIAEGAVHLRAEVLRTGKNAVHVQARFVDGAQTLAVLIGVFGTSRESVIRRLPAQAPVDSPKPLSFPYMPGISPAFTQHFKARWLRGSLPFTGGTLPLNIVEAGIDEDGSANESHVLAIADFVPPVAMTMMKKPVTGGTLTWMLEFFADRFDHLPLQNWRVDVDLVAAVDGYTSQSVMVWGPGGEPVALSRQSMVVFG